MKKLLAILLAGAMMFALTGCFGGSSYKVKNATTDEEAADISAKDYKKDFDGLQQYLLDKGYIYKFLYDENNTEKPRQAMTSEVYADVIGANDGIRYYFPDGKSFIEIYDYSGKQNDTAKEVLAEIKENGKFKPIEAGDELTGVVSESGKYLIIYNEKNKYDYEKITDELKNW